MSITDRITQLEREVGNLKIETEVSWTIVQEMEKSVQPYREKWINTKAKLEKRETQLETLRELAKVEASA